MILHSLHLEVIPFLAKTHVAFGILGGAIAYPFVGGDIFIFYTLVIIGSILPDIDHQNSSINKLMPVTNILPKIFKHRGLFHSVFAVAGIIALFSIFSQQIFGYYLAIGYTAHLLSDAMTKMGVNVFYPFTTFKLRGPITTGTRAEALAAAFALGFAILFWSGF